jgi:hypothetical protein
VHVQVEGPSPMVDPKYKHKGVNLGGGMSTTDRQLLTKLLYPSYHISNDERAIYVFYSWGIEASIVGGVDRHIQQLEIEAAFMALHGPEVEVEIVQTTPWQAQTNELGAFLLDMPGQTRFHEQRCSPEHNNTVFVGDDKSRWHGWIQGAIVSGVKAAKDICDLYKATMAIPVRARDYYFQLPKANHQQVTAGVEEDVICMAASDAYFPLDHSGVGLSYTTMYLQPNASYVSIPIGILITGEILNGEVEVIIAGESKVLATGQYYYVPPNTPHSINTYGMMANATIREIMPAWSSACVHPGKVPANVLDQTHFLYKLESTHHNQPPDNVRLGFGITGDHKIVMVKDGSSYTQGTTGIQVNSSVIDRILSLPLSSVASERIIFKNDDNWMETPPLRSTLASIMMHLSMDFCFQGVVTFRSLPLIDSTQVLLNVTATTIGCMFSNANHIARVQQMTLAKNTCSQPHSRSFACGVMKVVLNSSTSISVGMDSLVDALNLEASATSFDFRIYQIKEVEPRGDDATPSISAGIVAIIVLSVLALVGVGAVCCYRCKCRKIGGGEDERSHLAADPVQ